MLLKLANCIFSRLSPPTFGWTTGWDPLLCVSGSPVLLLKAMASRERGKDRWWTLGRGWVNPETGFWGNTGGQLCGLFKVSTNQSACLQVKHLYITKELDQWPLERLGSVRRSVGLSRRGKQPTRVLRQAAGVGVE